MVLVLSYKHLERAIAALRMLILVILCYFEIPLPYMISRESHDINELITHLMLVRPAEIEGAFPIHYFVVHCICYGLEFLTPKVATILLLFLIDYWTAKLLAKLVNRLNPPVEVNEDGKKPTYTAKGTLMFGIFLLNPISILYNYGTNDAGFRCFWFTLALYFAVRCYQAEGSHWGSIIMLHFTVGLAVIYSSFNTLALLPPLFYLDVYQAVVANRDKDHSDKSRFDLSEIKKVLVHLFPSILISIAVILCIAGTMGSPERFFGAVVDAEFFGKASQIDYSLFWYIQRLLPKEFMAGTLLKSHMMTFLYPLPLTVALRHRPVENAIIMIVIAMLTQPTLSLVGVCYILILLSLHYPLLEKIAPFTKMVVIITSLVAVTVGCYVSWAQRYMANPNHYFGPQIALTIAVCLLFEDYIRVNFFHHLLEKRSKPKLVEK